MWLWQWQTLWLNQWQSEWLTVSYSWPDWVWIKWMSDSQSQSVVSPVSHSDSESLFWQLVWLCLSQSTHELSLPIEQHPHTREEWRNMWRLCSKVWSELAQTIQSSYLHHHDDDDQLCNFFLQASRTWCVTPQGLDWDSVVRGWEVFIIGLNRNGNRWMAVIWVAQY